MAETLSRMVALGTPAPYFNLPDAITEKNVSIVDGNISKGTLIMFICNHCPFVKHLNHALVDFANEYQQKGLRVIAINSNDAINYPEDSPEQMKHYAETLGYSFPYLFDETQEIAKSYGAECTPDFFLYDKDLQLVYRGQFDGSRPGNGIPVTGYDMREATDALLSNSPIKKEQLPSIGCNIKWKKSL